MSENRAVKKSDTAATRDSEPFLVLAATRPVKRPFWRRWLVGIFVLTLAAGGAMAVQFKLFSTKDAGTKSGDVGQTTNGTAPISSGLSGAAENLAGLALQGISLFNGEKGAELWRLKATWAHLSQEGDTILVDAPVVRYTLGEPADEDYLDVKSEKGTITDSQRYLTLTGNVDVRHMGDTMTGPRLNYDSKTRVMVFPEGAALESVRATGKADVFTWDLVNNTMLAEGNVDVLIKPQEATPENAAAIPTAANPSTSGNATSAASGALNGALLPASALVPQIAPENVPGKAPTVAPLASPAVAPLAPPAAKATSSDKTATSKTTKATVVKPAVRTTATKPAAKAATTKKATTTKKTGTAQKATGKTPAKTSAKKTTPAKAPAKKGTTQKTTSTKSTTKTSATTAKSGS